MKKDSIVFADLTHTARGIHAPVFPLGTGYVAAYTNKIFGEEFEIKLFKFPEQLYRFLRDNDPPLVLALSNYSWNLELGYEYCKWAKNRYRNLIVVFGGPNFPAADSKKFRFLKERPYIDFYIEHEGEIAFADLIKNLRKYDFDMSRLKDDETTVTNCSYLKANRLLSGPVERIADLNSIPSPYLEGMFDQFFDYPLVPLVETHRGCPFSCTYCVHGNNSRNRVTRFSLDRINMELRYIAERVNKVDELMMSDANFSMYKEDCFTAECIAELQKSYNWPILLKVAAGKNIRKRTSEIAAILGGSWVVGSSIQSSDKTVLKNIKRNNIPIEAFKEFNQSCKELAPDSSIFSEIILGLPGDSKETHFNSLKYALASGANTLWTYQAILLRGTEMESEETRKRFRIASKFRAIPGCVGIYEFDGNPVSVAEIEEIIVETKDMTFDDYISCRVMNLIIEAFVNNSLFEEIFSFLSSLRISTFDLLVYLHENLDDLCTPNVKKTFVAFIKNTSEDLFDSYKEAKEYILRPDIINQYISGESGINELLQHKAEMYLNLDEVLIVLLRAINKYLTINGLYDETTWIYLNQLGEYILCIKKDFFHYDRDITKTFDYDFKSMENVNFKIHSGQISNFKRKVTYEFHYNKEQKRYIRNFLELYMNTPAQLGRLLQRINFKKVYRNVSAV